MYIQILLLFSTREKTVENILQNCDCIDFSTVFDISIILWQPVHLSTLSLSSFYQYTAFFPSHWLLSHITIIKTEASGKRGMNPVTMTIIKPLEEVDRTGDQIGNLFSSPICNPLNCPGSDCRM